MNIVAIDGPAASGKGTLARKVADKIGFAYLDTGALYRFVAHTVMQRFGDPSDKNDAIEAAEFCRDFFDPSLLDNPDLRLDEAGQAASKVAVVPKVRTALLDLQRNFAVNPGAGFKGAILDGRDIGTVICPDAPVKLFVTASDEVRAERRTKELQSKGISVTKAAVLKDMRERDARDAARDTAPMKPADDAITIDSSDLTPAEMLDKALDIIKERLSL
ncbi:MAG: (d)CMP kinase [Micavibrio sp.]|nr:(d)CMP kinase [Micavibrio sp.]